MNVQTATNIQQEINVNRQYSRIYKAIIAFSLILGLVLYRFLFTIKIKSPVCIIDAYQDATQSDNRDLAVGIGSAHADNSNQLTFTGKAMIGAGQIIMDIFIISLGIIWLFKIKNVRAFGAVAFFYLTRSVIFLNLMKFPFPNNIVWKSPGFYSITVPYDHTRDFYYSGHTGALVIIFLQMALLNLRVAAVLVFLSAIFMMNLLLITKVHYVIDIIGGIIFAVWYYRQAIRITLYIDKLLSLPFYITKTLYQKYKGYPPTQSHSQPQKQIKTSEDQFKNELNLEVNDQIELQVKNGNV